MEEHPKMPHCDERVLHAPGECRYCDIYPEWQQLRKLWGIAYTGHQPIDNEMSCPSDFARGLGAAGQWWSGNRATP